MSSLLLLFRSQQSKKVTYKLLGFNPVAYWPLNGNPNELINGYDGTPTDIIYGNGIKVGEQSGYFNGTSSRLNINNGAGIRALWNGADLGNSSQSQGSYTLWAKDDGNYGDSVRRRLFESNTRGDFNSIFAYKDNAPNTLAMGYYTYNGIVQTPKDWGGAFTPNGWFHFAITWDCAGNKVQAYTNGLPFLAAVTGLNAATTSADIASGIGEWYLGYGGGTYWKGWMAHYAWFNRPLTSIEILSLATI
jgi:hypothetical protein